MAPCTDVLLNPRLDLVTEGGLVMELGQNTLQRSSRRNHQRNQRSTNAFDLVEATEDAAKLKTPHLHKVVHSGLVRGRSSHFVCLGLHLGEVEEGDAKMALADIVRISARVTGKFEQLWRNSELSEKVQGGHS